MHFLFSEFYYKYGNESFIDLLDMEECIILIIVSLKYIYSMKENLFFNEIHLFLCKILIYILYIFLLQVMQASDLLQRILSLLNMILLIRFALLYQ